MEEGGRVAQTSAATSEVRAWVWELWAGPCGVGRAPPSGRSGTSRPPWLQSPRA